MKPGKVDTVNESWQHVVGYDWPSLVVPTVDSWEPDRPLSVVIPAYNCQEQLDLTLAALARQTYPAQLLEVVVADDGSSPPITMPELAPERTRLIRLERQETWGTARTRHAGALAAEGDILLFLDADMVTHREHLRAHARWHHVAPDAVTLGHKLFVDFAGISAADVYAATDADRLDDLLAGRVTETHEWVEALIERTQHLTAYRPTMFMAAVSSTVGMRADLYREAGGFRPHLRTGEDMEMAYRLMTAGGVFIPELEARSWHQGPATFMTRAEEVRRLNQPYFANYVPVPGAFRPWTPGRHYVVPMVRVLMEVGASYDATKVAVDAILGSTEGDLAIDIWGQAPEDCMALLRAQYEADPRVKLVEKLPATGFPSRFTLLVPPWASIGPESITAMLGIMEDANLGALDVVVAGVPAAEGTVTLWRTAALHRARRVVGAESTLTAAGHLFGHASVPGESVAVADRRRGSVGSTPAPQRPVDLLQRLARTQQELKTLRKRHRRLRKRHDELLARSTRSVGQTRARRPGKQSVRSILKLFSLGDLFQRNSL